MPRFFCFFLFFALLSAPLLATPAVKIALIVHKDEGFHNPFWDALQMGARKAAKELGVELLYHGIEPAFQKDRVAGQTKRFDEMTKAGAQAIVFTPADRLRMVPAVKDAVVHDIKVIAIDSPVESDLISGQLGTNNYQGGLLAAQRMANALQGKGLVIQLCHPMRMNQATLDREQSFADGLRLYAPAITLPTNDSCGSATVSGDSAAAASLFSKYKNVRGFYCVTGSCLPGALKALAAIKYPSPWPKLIGWDLSPEALQGLTDGTVEALMLQDPEKMGYEGVKAAYEALKGKENTFRQDTGVHLAHKGNLDSAVIKRLTHPRFHEWIR